MKLIHQESKKFVKISIIRDEDGDFIIVASLFGINIIYINLNDIFETIREHRSIAGFVKTPTDGK